MNNYEKSAEQIRESMLKVDLKTIKSMLKNLNEITAAQFAYPSLVIAVATAKTFEESMASLKFMSSKGYKIKQDKEEVLEGEYDGDKKQVLIYGSPGSGKTTLQSEFLHVFDTDFVDEICHRKPSPAMRDGLASMMMSIALVGLTNRWIDVDYTLSFGRNDFLSFLNRNGEKEPWASKCLSWSSFRPSSSEVRYKGNALFLLDLVVPQIAERRINRTLKRLKQADNIMSKFKWEGRI